MVPVRKLQLLRDAHATPFAATAAGLGVTTAPPPPSHMAQEPIDQHQEPSKPPPPQESQAGHETSHGVEADAYLAPRLLHPAGHHQEAAGTSGSSNGGSSGNGGAGDWLRLGLAPASPSAGAGSRLAGIFADRAGPPPPLGQTRSTEVPLGPFLRPAVPGIPHMSIALPVPRAGTPWMRPWSPAAVAGPPPSLLPFAHRVFYTPGAGAGASGLDTIRDVVPPAAIAAAVGVWFVLQAAPHQGREPFLPQIPRSYLRIKVTVRLLIKYLVSKLGLEDESEVEITCRGRSLLPFLTLQHVRDSIWCQGDAFLPSVVPDMPAANHLMVLQYGRRP